MNIKKIYRYLVNSNAKQGRQNDEYKYVERHFFIIVSIRLLSNIASQLANTKTTLTWLASSIGVPPFLIGLFVPLRESLSLIPQALLASYIQGYTTRRYFYFFSLLGQAIVMICLIFIILNLTGIEAGVAFICCLCVFALMRCIGSLSSKELLGNLIPKSQRGQLAGTSASLSGFCILIIGVLIFLGVIGFKSSAAWLLLLAVGLWVISALICLLLKEGINNKNGMSKEGNQKGMFAHLKAMLKTLKHDKNLKTFILARAFLVSSGMSSPFILLLSKNANDSPTNNIKNLGIFIILNGLASLISARFWGRFADANSLKLIKITALFTAITCIITAAFSLYANVYSIWVIGALFFSISVIHQGVRIGRKTYIIDLAEGDKRTRYISLSNTIIGIIIFPIGAMIALTAQFSLTLALTFLSVLPIFGLFYAARLPKL